MLCQKILSTLGQGFWRDFSLSVQNVYDKYPPQSIKEQISESFWNNNNIHIDYIKQWFENSVRHIRDVLDSELKVNSRQDFITRLYVKFDFLMFESVRFRIRNYLINSKKKNL